MAFDDCVSVHGIFIISSNKYKINAFTEHNIPFIIINTYYFKDAWKAQTEKKVSFGKMCLTKKSVFNGRLLRLSTKRGFFGKKVQWI